jgi:hypothetical protein
VEISLEKRGNKMKLGERESFWALVIISILVVALGITVSGQSGKHNGQSSAPAGANVQPLNVKPGLWETTMAMSRTGDLPIPEATLQKLTPEQRARFEERMKASQGQTNTMTHKSCLTKEQLDNPDFTDKKQCTWTTLESNGTRTKGSAVCIYPDIDAKLTGTGEIIAVDQEHIKGTIHMTGTGSGHRMDTDAKLTAKWLGSSCGKVK